MGNVIIAVDFERRTFKTINHTWPIKHQAMMKSDDLPAMFAELDNNGIAKRGITTHDTTDAVFIMKMLSDNNYTLVVK